MTTPASALYARVSSEQQAQAQTIDSQLAALRERIAREGALLSPEHLPPISFKINFRLRLTMA